MTLGQKQRLFSRLIAHLIDHIYTMGYEVSFGEAWRPHEGTYPPGSKPRCHSIRLAVDLNLFHDGRYLSSTEAHTPFGEYWESLDPDCRWGGRFNDGNHYSITHRGMA
jgi:hypothetical protein